MSAQRGSLETEVNLRLTERHPGGRLLRAHRLEADGSLTVWRITRRRVMD